MSFGKNLSKKLVFFGLISSYIFSQNLEENFSLNNLNKELSLKSIEHYWKKQNLPNRELLDSEIEIFTNALENPEVLNWFFKKIEAALKNNSNWEILRRKVLKKSLAQYRNTQYHSAKDIRNLEFIIDKVCAENNKTYLYNLSEFITYPLLDTRRKVYSCLAKMKDDRIFPLLSRLAYSKNPIERTYALDAFYFIHDERTVPFLLESLKDKNESVRYYAIRTLEQMKRNEAIPFYIRIIQEDLDEEVRILCLKILRKLRPQRAFYPLTKVIKDDNPNIRKAALITLTNYQNKKAGYSINQQLKQEPKVDLQILQIQALQTLNTSGGMSGINYIIAKGSPQSIIWALHLAGKLRDKRALELAQKKLSNKNPKIRAQAAWTLGQIKNTKALKDLIERIKDQNEDYMVQTEAINAVEKLYSDKAFNPLYNLLRTHPDSRIRQQISKSLQRLLKKRFPHEL